MARHRHHHRRHNNSGSGRPEHAILCAIRDGNVDELHRSFSKAKDEDSLPDVIFWNAMDAACERSDLESLRFLVSHATLKHINDTPTDDKETLLMKAKSKEVVQLLLANGADINALDDTGCTALMHAVSKDVAETLIDAGADLETQHKPSKSALMHVLLQTGSSMANVRGEIAHLLIEKGARLDATDNLGRTILMTAVWKNEVSVVQSLLDKGVNVDAKDNRDRNILHHICEDEARAQRLSKALDDPDKPMMDLVLGLKVDHNARERHNGQTPLHLAIDRNNVRLAQELLKGQKIQIETQDNAGRRPIHIAAAKASNTILAELIKMKAKVNSQAKGGWTPLHDAAAAADDAGLDFAETIRILLQKGADPTARLQTGKTPLHLACEAGNVEVVEIIRVQRNVDIMARDSEGDTPLISAAKVGQSDLVKVLAPVYLLSAQSSDAVKASQSFQATIVDFSQDFRNGNRRDSRPMYDLLFEEHPPISPNLPEDSIADLNQSADFRWIHCPSNNITWCQQVLLKRFLELDGADADGFKTMEKSFNHQHRGKRLHSHYMRPTCRVVPQELFDDERSLPEQETLKRSTSKNDTNHPEGSILSLPVGRSRGRSTSARSSKKAAQKGHARHASETTLRTTDAVGGTKSDMMTLSPSPAAHERAMVNNMFMFSPYLHYEINSSRREMQDTIHKIRTPEDLQPGHDKNKRPQHALEAGDELAGVEADQELISAHISKTICSMNARRTLDQYYYRTINTRRYRDHDQVVHRYQAKDLRDGQPDHDIKMLMVDQLWMWIIGKDLVLTSFPQRWGRPRDDAHNLLETIISDINLPRRASISSVYELAFIIASRCFGAFDRHNTKEGEMLFLDMFESSIGDAMDHETALFRNFDKASEEASHWLKLLSSPGKTSVMYDQSYRSPKTAKDQAAGAEDEKETERKEQGLVATLLNIGEETRLMREIKDIRDELNMLRMIFKEQERLLLELRKNLLEMIRRDGGTLALVLERSIKRMYADAAQDITNPLQDIDRMDTQAGRIYDSVRDLLNLKQNYAVSMQAADTARQGRTLMVFTVVTVIFLPLSFLTAFFALDIKDFPHNADGAQEMPLSFVSKFVFGIGFVVAVFCVFLALAWERVGAYIRRGRKKEWHLRHSKRHPQAHAGQHGPGTNLQRAASWHSITAMGGSNTAQRQPSRRRAPARDLEMGNG